MNNRLSFEKLYDEDKLAAYQFFLLWVNDWLDGFDAPQVTIDEDLMMRFINNLQKSDFPAYGGFSKASPFKKAAYIYVYLHNLNPFVGTLPENMVGEEIGRHSYSTASLVGLSIVRECLWGAELTKKSADSENTETVTIENPLDLSKHLLIDLVEASGGITPREHFKIFSLLFEVLVYEANPGLSYSKCFKC